MSDLKPEDVYDRLHGIQKNLLENKGDSKNITRTSAKLDDGIKTIEDKVIYWQERINSLRISVMQNEQFVILFCILLGIVLAYSINECTGNIDIPAYVYVLIFLNLVWLSLLMIPEGSLPFIAILKLVSAYTVGHAWMMLMIALDGHFFKWFVTDVCRYPFTKDTIMWVILGAIGGYAVKSIEEIKEKGKP